MQRQNGLLIESAAIPSIVVDMDDVICNTCDILQKVLTMETGIDIPVSDWTDHHLNVSYPMLSNQDIDNIIKKYRVFSRVEVLPGAVEALSTLKSNGYKIHICTARANIDNHKYLTQSWLTQHRIPYDTVNYVGYGQSKSQIYGTIDEQFCYLFDDAIHNIQDALTSGLVVKPVLVNKPWNVNHSGTLRTNGLLDFCKNHGLVV